jgi:hypothetical protein
MTFNFKAKFLRRMTATDHLEDTLKKAVSVLAQWDIPHYVCGGLCVQERGYPRLTVDVDLVVPNVQLTVWRLQQSGLFRAVPGTYSKVKDKETGVEIDLLWGGSTKSTGHISAPMPTTVSDEPTYLGLNELIEMKLSAGRAKDVADVVELIKANNPPRNYDIDLSMLDAYQRAWDTAAREQEGQLDWQKEQERGLQE